MNKEEIDKWLDNEYGVSYTSLEEIHDWLVDENIKKDKEIERLSKEVTMYDELLGNINNEVERLNNIINKTRKGLDRFYKEHSRLMWNEEDYIEFINCIDRELKGDSSNE